jgi:hypothetical protein
MWLSLVALFTARDSLDVMRTRKLSEKTPATRDALPKTN